MLGLAARRAAHLADRRPRVPALGGLLPRAGLHDRRRHHLQGPDGSRSTGSINKVLAVVRHRGARLAHRPAPGPLSIALVDVWKGVGIATLIYIAGIVAIPQEYYEAAKVDGASALAELPAHHAPAGAPATATVVLLSLIGGLRSFELIWAMTRGGPGFTSDVLASVIYKQYQAGFYGLSTAGNVILSSSSRRSSCRSRRASTDREVEA